MLADREMRRMGKSALRAARTQAAEATYVDEERDLVQRISEFVTTQANRLIEMADPMLQVDSDSLL